MSKRATTSAGGFLTDGLRITIQIIESITLQFLLGLVVPLLRPRRLLTAEQLGPEFTKRRALAVDCYISGWIIFEICLSLLVIFDSLWIVLSYAGEILTIWRLVEILQAALGITIFDSMSGRSDQKVASPARIIVLGGINFVEIMILFGLIYAINFQYLAPNGLKPVQGFYLSAITQFTIGSGDISPRGFLKAVVVAQGFVTTTIIILVFGRVIASFNRFIGILDIGDDDSERIK